MREGYRVIEFDTPGVIDELESENDRIEMVITNSPGNLLAFADSVPILYMGAGPDLELAALFSICRVLQKPFRPTELLSAVRELTGSV